MSSGVYVLGGVGEWKEGVRRNRGINLMSPHVFLKNTYTSWVLGIMNKTGMPTPLWHL